MYKNTGCILPNNITHVLPKGKKQKAPQLAGPLNMADSEGFEPPVGLTLRLISSQAAILNLSTS